MQKHQFVSHIFSSLLVPHRVDKYMSRAENSKRFENGMIKLLRKFLKKRCQHLGKWKGNPRSLKGGAVGNVGPTGDKEMD